MSETDTDVTIDTGSDAHPAETVAAQQPPVGHTSTAVANLTADDWAHVEDWAASRPLTHPLAFSLRQGYDYAPPPHLVELYQSVFSALSPDYPASPKNLLRMMPRDHGKSEAGSVVLPAWAALQNPNIRILILMHRTGKAAGKLEQVAEIVRANLDLGYQTVGREHAITKDTNTQLTLARSENHDVPTVEAAGFKTGHEGGHYDLIIMDDIVTLDLQRTEQMRRKVIEDFNNILHLGDEGETTFLTLGTRKHANDLYGWLAGKGAWDTVIHKAISDFSVVENREYDLVGQSGTLYPPSRLGDLPAAETLVDVEPHREVPVLWPDKFSLSDLIYEYLKGSDDAQGDSGPDSDVESLTSGVEWIREKQNNPHATQGQILNREMLNFVPPDLPPGVNERNLSHYIGVDIALEADPEKATSGDSDYWALAVVSYDRKTGQAFLTDMSRRRGMTMQQGVEWVIDLLPEQYACLAVESVQAQEFVTQTINNHGYAATSVRPSGDKEQRVMGASSWFENGTIQIAGEPDTAQWQSFINEWVSFPTGNHDDMLDAATIALAAFQEFNNGKQAQFHFT